MTTLCGIECPCYGTLEEVHKELIGDDLKWKEKQVSIDGRGYTVTEKGFRSNSSEKEYTPSTLSEFLHPGTAILIGIEESASASGSGIEWYQIETTGKIPHISKRCALCGMQLNQEEQKYGACGPCMREFIVSKPMANEDCFSFDNFRIL
jgi:hypothetical protein